METPPNSRMNYADDDLVVGLRWHGGVYKRQKCIICVANHGRVFSKTSDPPDCGNCPKALSPVTRYSKILVRPTQIEQRFMDIERKEQLKYLSEELLDAYLAGEIELIDLVGTKTVDSKKVATVRTLPQALKARNTRVEREKQQGHSKGDLLTNAHLARLRRSIQDQEGSFLRGNDLSDPNDFLELVELELILGDRYEATNVMRRFYRYASRPIQESDQLKGLLLALELNHQFMLDAVNQSPKPILRPTMTNSIPKSNSSGCSTMLVWMAVAALLLRLTITWTST